MTAPTSVPATGKPPRRARRRLIALGVVTLAAGAGLAGLVAPAAFAGIDGGVNMQEACQLQWGSSYGAVLQGSNVFDWRCVGPGDPGESINVNEECVAQYGPGATALFSDNENPYTWYCLS